MSQSFQWTASQSCRLKQFVKQQLPHLSQSTISQSIRFHRCYVNGLIERFESYKLLKGDMIVFYPYTEYVDTSKLPIILETPHYLVYEKPAHISSEEIATKNHLQLIHRLDRDTSGCFLAAKTNAALEKFSKLFKNKQVKKKYSALVHGIPKNASNTIKNFTAPVLRRNGAVVYGVTKPKQGKETITVWHKIREYSKYTLISCTPITGRTHQIRVHMKHINHPIVGDVDYGYKKQPPNIHRPLLHSVQMEFICPFDNTLVTVRSSKNLDDYINLLQI